MVVVAGSVSRVRVMPATVAEPLAFAVKVPAVVLLIWSVQERVYLPFASGPVCAWQLTLPSVLGVGETVIAIVPMVGAPPPFGSTVITAVKVCASVVLLVAVVGPIVMNASGAMFTNATEILADGDNSERSAVFVDESRM